MTHITRRLTAKTRDQLRNPTLCNRVWATFTFLLRWSIHLSMFHTLLLLLLLLLHPFNGLFSRTTWVSRYQKGRTSLDLNEARDDGVLGWKWHQLDHMQTICTSLQTDNHTNTSSVNFYRLDALPDVQLTVSYIVSKWDWATDIHLSRLYTQAASTQRSLNLITTYQPINLNVQQTNRRH